MFTTLDASIPGANDYLLEWEPPDLVDDPNILNPQTDNLTSTQVFTFNATNETTGCTGTDQVTITVNGTALSTDILPADQSICSDENITLTTNTSGGAEDYTYSWTSDPAGFTSSQAAPVVSPNQTTTYTLTVDDGYNQVTDQVTITVSTAPDFDAGPEETTFCGDSYRLSNASADHVASIWWTTDGDGIFSMNTLEQPRYYPQGDDWANGQATLTMTVTGNGACTADYSDEITLFFAREPEADAGASYDLCDVSDTLLADATFDNYSALSWSTSGTGTFDDNTLQQPTYSASADDITSGQVTLTATVSNPPCEDVTVTKTLNLYTLPTVEAGTSDTVCELSPIVPDAVATNASTLQWSTSGSGFFSDATIQNPEYTPSEADITSGQVTLTLEALTDAPCDGNFTDSLTLTIQQEIELTAGADTSLCGPVDHVITHSSAINYDTLLWTTSGSGTFSDNILHPVFTPTPEDVEQGIIQVSLTGSNAVCPEVSDTMDVALYIIPLIYMAEDTTICSSEALDLSATEVDHYLTITWQTNGTGTFSDATAMKPVYTPSAQDIDNGQVILTCAADTATACEGPFFEQMTVNILQPPEATVEENLSFCGFEAHPIEGATAIHQQDVLWTTDGTGTLDDATTLSPTYTPSEADMATGSVELYLTVSNQACEADTDTVTVSLYRHPEVQTEPEAFICSDETYLTNPPQADYYSTLQWTGGDGTFDDATQLESLYTPGTGDITSGQATLSLELFSDASCEGPYQDSFTLSIAQKPTIHAGPDTTVCEQVAHLIPATTATAYDSLIWKSTGTGSWSNRHSPAASYTPSTADLDAGEVTLTLEAYKEHCSMVADQRTVTLFRAPEVQTEADAFICSDETYVTNPPQADFYSTLQWSGGDGAFDNAAQLQSLYTPGTGDITTGQATLTLELFSDASCEGPYQDSFTLNIAQKPTVHAGPDTTVCEQVAHVIPATTATAFDSLIWKSTGTGSWSDRHSPAASYTPSTADLDAGQVTLTLEAYKEHCSMVADQRTVTLFRAPEVQTEADAFICSDETYVTNPPQADYYSTLQWTGGDGAFDDATGLQSLYTPGTGDITSGQATLTLELFSDASCEGPYQDSFTLNIAQKPTVHAGPDTTVCEQVAHVIPATTATAYDSLIWKTSGSGSWADRHSPEATYTPSDNDIATGQVTLTLEAYKEHCSMVADARVVTLTMPPTVEAGSTATFCQDATYQVGDATATGYSTLSWSTTGDGTLGGAGTLSPQYTPGPQDIAAGQVTLTLEAFTTAPCQGPFTDSRTLTITPAPEVEAGDNIGLCEADTVQVTGSSLLDYDSFVWSSSGDGTFLEAQTLSPRYVPGVQDSQNEGATLTLTATNGPCQDYSDALQVSIQPLPDVYAGADTVVLPGTAYTVSDAALDNYSSFLWTTSGSGTFSNPTAEHPTYTPSFIDSVRCHVTLTVTAQGLSGCNTQQSDQVYIAWGDNPFVDFFYTSPCEDTPVSFTVDTIITDTDKVTDYLWDFGNGESSTLMNPTYTYPVPGSYQVSLTITDTLDNTYSEEKTIVVAELPAPFFDTDAPSCDGSAVQFTDYTNTPSGYATSWYWDFGDGQDTLIDFPDSPHVEHVYTQAATYAVTLTVETNLGCVSDYTREVTVSASPITLFEWDAACSEQPTVFTDLSVENGGGDLTAWHWDFDDPESGTSNTSEQQHPQHTFSGPGSYAVTLVTENITGCTDTLTQTVSVSAAPMVAFTGENTCYGQLSTFTADATVMDTAAIATWLWDFGDGYTSNDPVTAQHLYNVAGSYSAMLTVTDTAGCTATATETIEVLPLPQAQFDYDQPACFGNAVQFDDYSTTEEGYITTWYYQFGDGSDTTITHPQNPNVAHSYATPGDYEATLTVTSSTGCEDAITHTVTVEPTPEVNFAFSQGCQNAAVQFEDLTQEAGSGDILSWSWHFGDPLSGVNNTSSQQDPQHTYTEAGDYTVTLVVTTANGCSDSLSQEINISPAPTSGFEYTAGCLGDTTQFTSSTVVDTAAISSYSWSFGDGGTSAAMDPVHIYTQEGAYVVSLTVTDTAGCSATAEQTVPITPLPTAAFTYTQNSCANTPVQFDDQSFSEGSALVSWQWSFGDGQDTLISAPDIPDVQHQYAAAGTYEATLTVTTGSGCTHSATHSVQVLATPQAQFTFEGQCQNEVVSFTDASQTGGGSPINSWSWNFDDPSSGADNSSTLPNPQHLFTTADTFDVQLVVGNLSGCSDTLVQQVGVSAPPTVAINAPLTTCQDVATLFAPDTAVVDTAAIASYMWTFGDGSGPVYEQSTEHTYAQPGDYLVTLSVTDTTGCTGEATTVLTVSETPTAVFSYQDACLGGATLFEDASFTESGQDITQWYWDFGDPYADSAQNHSSLQHPEHVYSTDSTYQVKLVVWTAGGCVDSITSDVLVRPVPQAWFSYDTTACQGGQVYFYDSSWSDNSAITAWQWTFEQGYTSDLKNPSYTFSATDTTYQVELVAYDAFGCSDTVTRPVGIPEGFAVDFNLTPTCLGDTTYFNDSLVSPEGDSIIAVSWTFGDPSSGGANVSDQHDPEHYYGQAGTYTITLEATNSSYCTTTVSKALQVHALPEPAFSWQSYPCDSAVYVSDMSTTQGVISQWVWHWGDGSAPDTVTQGNNPDISHVYGAAGSYAVTLEVTGNNGCVNTITQQVYREPCVAAMIALQTDTLCQGSVITFADSSRIQEVIESWRWDFGDGSAPVTYTSYQEEITHSYGDTGTFEVALTVEAMYDGQLRVNTDSATITIRPAPAARFDWNDICQVQAMAFEDQTGTDSADIVSWQWDFGEAIEEDTSTQQHPGWLYSAAGYYDVRLSVMNEYGCADSTTQEVTVHRAPEAQITHDTSCFMDPTLFEDGTDTTGLAGQIVSWQWDFGVEGIRGDTSNLPEPEYVYISEGSRMVTLAVEDAFGCRDTAQQVITTHPVPGAAFEVEQDYEQMQGRFALTNSSEEAVEYGWDFGMVPYHYDQEYHENNENPVIVYEDDGWVEITLIAWNQFQCPDTAVYADSLLFKGLFVPNAFSPNNPHAGVRNFKPVGINLESYHMQVYDVRGNLLWETREVDAEGSPTESWDGTFEGEPLPQGVYVWKAEGMFKDGTVWKGDEVGTSTLGSGKRYGTVTIVR